MPSLKKHMYKSIPDSALPSWSWGGGEGKALMMNRLMAKAT